MGIEKFYDSPEGRFRIAELERSGVSFDRRSVQYRLLSMHIERQAALRYAVTNWALSKAMDVISILTQDKVQDAWRQNYLKSNAESVERIAGLLNPYRFEEQKKKSEEPKKATEQDKERYLEALNAVNMKGYSSLGELLNAMKALSDTASNLDKTVSAMKNIGDVK